MQTDLDIRFIPINEKLNDSYLATHQIEGLEKPAYIVVELGRVSQLPIPVYYENEEVIMISDKLFAIMNEIKHQQVSFEHVNIGVKFGLPLNKKDALLVESIVSNLQQTHMMYEALSSDAKAFLEENYTHSTRESLKWLYNNLLALSNQLKDS